MRPNSLINKYGRYGKPWNTSDIERLTKLYPRNHDYRLARIFGRTQLAIRSKADELGLKKDYDDEFTPNWSTEMRRWTEHEIKTLKKLFPAHTIGEIAEKIGRSALSVGWKARCLRLRKISYWTQEEDDILRRFYKEKSYRQLAKLLPLHTPAAVKTRIFELGLESKLNPWTERELELLAKHYPTMETTELAKLLGRPANLIVGKARTVGIRKSREIIVSGGLKWSKEDIKKIQHTYRNHTARETAKIMGYPFEVIRPLLHRFNLGGKSKPWTKKDDAIIRKYYKRMTYKELAAKIGRSVKATGFHAQQMGLIKEPLWGEVEIEVLKGELKKHTAVRQIAKLIGKSEKACRWKIWHLGLKITSG